MNSCMQSFNFAMELNSDQARQEVKYLSFKKEFRKYVEGMIMGGIVTSQRGRTCDSKEKVFSSPTWQPFPEKITQLITQAFQKCV